MGGKKPEQYKGIAKFFTYLSSVPVQQKWHEDTGYLPITTGGLREDQGRRVLRQEPGHRDRASCR